MKVERRTGIPPRGEKPARDERVAPSDPLALDRSSATALPSSLAKERRRLRVRRGAYLLPSLFTIGNIFLGFYAIVIGLRSAGLMSLPGGNFAAAQAPVADPRAGFTLAAVLVFCAAILDALDGRIARMVGTESDFGKELDSLADVFTFGVAPALLTYLWGLHEWGRVGWLVPFFYLVCTATRLARFNVQTRIIDARFFVGLPAPTGAGAICSILFFAPDSSWWRAFRHDEIKTWVQVLVLLALLLVGTLMVSTFRYRSFKKFDPLQRWSYRVFVPLALIVLVLAYAPRPTLLVFAVLYTLSGPVGHFWSRLRRRSGRGEEPPAPEEPADGAISAATDEPPLRR